jgi:hypothetical protein
MPRKSQRNLKRYSLEFGKKEKVLNYTSQTYQLTRPAKVGAVMSLIRECQPTTYEEWKRWFFENASTAAKQPSRVTEDSLKELGERLYEKIVEVVIPEWTSAFQQVTKQDCIDYIYNLTINRTYDGYLREKSVVFDVLAQRFPTVLFEESEAEMDHAGDIDFLGYVGELAFGLQIKPVTSKANFGNYSPSERMRASFGEFSERFKGQVFIVYSLDGEVANPDVVDKIDLEVTRLRAIKRNA